MDAIPSFVFLILALALLVLAGGLGIWVYNYITGKGSASPKRKRPSATGMSAEMEAAIAAGAQELLSVHRLERGELAVFVQGQRYYHLRGIQDAQMGIEAVEAVVRVMSFAEGWLPALQQRMSQSSPAKSAVDAEAFLEQLRQSDLFPQETPSPGLLGQMGRKSSQPLAPLLTPADQINNLVQERMQGQPDLLRRNIRITTSADGSLRFRVGLDTFTEIDEIPDPEVMALIQDAIREWKES
ncbi:MAG: hypothetical protein V3S14_03390 [Anaerolineae bacterium]